MIGDIGGQHVGTSVFRTWNYRILLSSAFVVILALSAATRWYVPGAVFIVMFLITIFAQPLHVDPT